MLIPSAIHPFHPVTQQMYGEPLETKPAPTNAALFSVSNGHEEKREGGLIVHHERDTRRLSLVTWEGCLKEEVPGES
jgi:hypothetical protein